MFRFARLILLALLALFLILLAVANRDTVTLQLMPDQLAGIFQVTGDVPLFVLMIVMAGGGFALGYSVEYIREWKIRSEARRAKKEAKVLEQEVKSLRAKTGDDEDDVLALLK
ncbi:putative integral membrane protein [Rubricella aquisinus]|uniref:Putative integral membrane protein n=1 Tax=Rubricella aquisinus TaxID=2028108 RepID=A0A840X1R0_9RHOB|nr:LapA family protein [Rubricella aquisinus]MBB5516714.1 putative integral membrane protein [Rubricella aquisinus]